MRTAKGSASALRSGAVAALWALSQPAGAGADTRDGEAPPPLRWKFQAGQTLRYEFRQRSEIRMRAGGTEGATTTGLTLDLVWEVGPVAGDGTAAITQRLDRARVKVETAGSPKVEYDSRDPKAPADPVALALHGVYRAAVGADYALKVDPRGRVVEVKLPGKVLKAVQGTTFQAGADGGGVFSEPGVKNMLAQVIPALPEKAIAKGASWDATLDLPSPPLNLTLRNAYTLSALGADHAKIDAAVAVDIRAGVEAGFALDVKKTSGTGAYSFDAKAGRLSDSEVRQSLELVLNAAGREVFQEVKVELRLTLKP